MSEHETRKQKYVATCVYCNSNETKKTFLGGAGKTGAFIAIALGGFASFSMVMSGSRFNFGPIFLLLGIIALFVKKYKCHKCKRTFS